MSTGKSHQWIEQFRLTQFTHAQKHDRKPRRPRETPNFCDIGLQKSALQSRILNYYKFGLPTNPQIEKVYITASQYLFLYAGYTKSRRGRQTELKFLTLEHVFSLFEILEDDLFSVSFVQREVEKERKRDYLYKNKRNKNYRI